MGIGNTVKDMFKNEPTVTEGESGRRTDEGVGRTYDREVPNDPTRMTNSNPASHRLPSGAGVGTSGQRTSQSAPAMEQDFERTRSQGAAGYGTDAASAVGGSLSGTHQGVRTTGLSRSSAEQDIHVGPTSTNTTGDSGQPMGGSRVETKPKVLSSRPQSDFSGAFHPQHDLGHAQRDTIPSGETIEDTSQLRPVTHEHIRHLETEDVERVKDHERHIHHVQHHTQPILTSQQLPETHRDYVHPVTRIQEQHVNKVEENTLFDGQVHQHRNTTEHGAKERTIVDKGIAITEHVHHHIHHVIQPIIEKETVDRQFTHTKIPIVEVIHEAPIVHQSQTHAPIPLEHFVERGGVVDGGVFQDEIAKRVLQSGECTREVDGIAADLERDMGLDPHQVIRKDETHPQYITTKVTKRTTTVDEPAHVPPVHN